VWRCGIRVLGGVAFCVLCCAWPVIADDGDRRQDDRRQDDRNRDDRGAPEIDMGAATGALTIVAGALTLLGERLRRP